MSQSLANILVHIIFSTKGRRPLISDELREELHRYLAGTLHNLQCPGLIVGSAVDHVHILCSLSRGTTISNLVENLKRESSKWLKSRGEKLREFYWQGGYGAFSVSESMVPLVRRYIENQRQYHRTVSFEDEFREFLRRHRVDFDEGYVWD